MTYVVTHRAKFDGICGRVNIPYGTELECNGEYIMLDGDKVCSVNSKRGRSHFAPNYDGNGLERGELISSIKSALEERDGGHQTRWDRIWGALMCQRYRNLKHGDVWVWNQEFYEAPISDLRSIAALVGVK